MEMLDPFIHMDQMGEVEYAPGEPKGTPWHPHRGFETVTYIIDGTFQHRDSAGGGGLITNGDTQWMTAGAGILHIERPPQELVDSGGLFHGIQLWVNLPAKDKMVPSAIRTSVPTRSACAALPTAGHCCGSSPAIWERTRIQATRGATPGTGHTYTPITLVHATVSPGAELDVPWPRDFNALVYVLAGHGSVGAEKRPIHTGQLAALGAGDVIHLGADRAAGPTRPGVRSLLLGGRPIREPVATYGPFVMNQPRELAQAFEDFNKGLMGVVPPDER